MISSTKFLLMAVAVLLLCSQLTQAFCVYNNLEGDGASFYAFGVVVEER